MKKTANSGVVTRRAPCGLMCANCESLLAKVCAGCYNENARRKAKCPIVEGEPFTQSVRLIECMSRSRVATCVDCKSFGDCEVYQDLLLRCPFKVPARNLRPGFGYLVKEKKPDLGFKVFGDIVRHGANGLLITRQHPKNLNLKLGLGQADIYWLTSLAGEGNIQPTDLGIISNLIINFMSDVGDTVILLDGVELLITQNDFPKVLRMVNHIIEIVMQKDTRFVITLDERTLDPKELALLERNMEIVKG